MLIRLRPPRRSQRMSAYVFLTAMVIGLAGFLEPPAFAQISRAELEAMTPESANPYLAMLPSGTTPDWDYWNAKIHYDGKDRHQDPVPTITPPFYVVESELNNTPDTAQIISEFGTEDGDEPVIQVLGSIAAPLEPVDSGSPEEDDSSISFATVLGIIEPERQLFSAFIGDGPYGSAGTGTGDFDFFRLPDLEEGDLITAETIIEHPVNGTDTIMALYDSTGVLIEYNDDEDFAVSHSSKIEVAVPAAGDYIIAVGGYLAGTPESSLLTNPFDALSGQGVGAEGSYELLISVGAVDRDFFEVELRAGDILGVSGVEAATAITLLDSNADLLLKSRFNFSGIYPLISPLPGSGDAALAYVIPEDGIYYILAEGFVPGEHRVDMSVFRNVFEVADPPEHQVLFLDFDGELIDCAIFDPFANFAFLSPLSAFIADWGLALDDEDDIIDAILKVVDEKLRQDLFESGNNGNFWVEIRNSRDHLDLWDDPESGTPPNWSRVIVGGTVFEAGIFTLGIAQSIDPGNFNTNESALVLLDSLSDPGFPPFLPPSPDSINSIEYVPLTDGTKIRLIGEVVGNITAHEAGHFFGNFHTDNAGATFGINPNIMDRGGNGVLDSAGVGPDQIFGTLDDIDVTFGVDVFSFAEGFLGIEDTLNTTAFGLSYFPVFDPDIVYVDFAALLNGDGTVFQPFNVIEDAIAVANSNAEIRIFPSTSSETPTITKPVRLINQEPLEGIATIGD